MGQQAGTTALTLAGTVIGAAVAGPIGGMIGGMAGGLIGSAIFNRQQKPLIPDWQLASSSYGRPIPRIFGQVRLPGTVMWETPITVHSHGVGKGAGGDTTDSYFQSVAFAFCQGPANLLKIWLDGNLFWDATTGNPHEITRKTFAIRAYNGTEDQLPDPLIAQWVAGNVVPGAACPAYRGVAYLVFQQIDLANYGGRMPNVTALWSSDSAEKVIVTKLQRWAADVSTDVSLYAVAPDWVRGVVYQLSHDGTLRAFDVATGQCIAANSNPGFKTPAGAPTPGAAIGLNYAGGVMSVIPGGNIYISSNSMYGMPGEPYAAQPLVFTVNPVTLSVTDTTIVSVPGGYPGQLPNDVFFGMVAFTLSGPAALDRDLLACRWCEGSAFIMDPANNAQSQNLPVPVGLAQQTDIILGKQDTIAGTVDIWWLSHSPWVNTLTVQKSTVSQTGIMAQLDALFNTFPVSFEVVATLSSTAWGVANPPFDWGPSPTTQYDPSDDALIIHDGGLNATLKMDSSGNILWVAQGGFPAIGPSNYNLIDNGQVGGTYTGNDFGLGDAFGGATITIPNNSGTPINTIGPAFGYDAGSNAVVVRDYPTSNLYVAYLQRQAPNDIPLADIVTAVCGDFGLGPSMIDVSQVTATVTGYSITTNASAGSCLADLCQCFQIDMVESDYTLKFVPRGRSPVATITQDQLGLVDANDPSSFWLAKRAQEQELPLQINVRFNDPGMDFQPNATYARRVALPVPTQWSKRTQTLDMPIVTDATSARTLAENWLYTLWAARDTYKTGLSAAFLMLDPTDNVTVTMDNGDSYTVRVQNLDVGADYSLQVDLAAEDISTYRRSASPPAAVGYQPQTVTPAPYLDLLQFNVPLLQDGDDLGGAASRIYYAAAPMSGAGTGQTITLYQSVDGASWSQFAQFGGTATVGHAKTKLGAPLTPFATDTQNTLTVAFPAGATLPASCSYSELMNNANAALVGQEIIQFQTVTDNPDGTVTLSTLIRGCRGTDWALADHTAGETVVLLAAGQVQGGRIPLNQINQAESWRLVPYGRYLDNAVTEKFTYLGYDLMPYAPVHVSGTYDAGGDIVVTWVRQTRLGGGLMDGTDTVPLGETSEAYDVEVINPATGAVVRAFSGLTGPTVTYTAAEVSADWTTAPATLSVKVYQRSSVVGRGFSHDWHLDLSSGRALSAPGDPPPVATLAT